MNLSSYKVHRNRSIILDDDTKDENKLHLSDRVESYKVS